MFCAIPSRLNFLEILYREQQKRTIHDSLRFQTRRHCNFHIWTGALFELKRHGYEQRFVFAPSNISVSSLTFKLVELVGSNATRPRRTLLSSAYVFVRDANSPFASACVNAFPIPICSVPNVFICIISPTYDPALEKIRLIFSAFCQLARKFWTTILLPFPIDSLFIRNWSKLKDIQFFPYLFSLSLFEIDRDVNTI